MMKTILAATDFSPAARHAIDYAAALARHTGSRLILFHAWYTPPATIEFPVASPSWEEIEKDTLIRLNKIKTTLLSQNAAGPGIEIECTCSSGFAVDAIRDYVAAHHTGMVVMGMQGAGYLAEHLVGSITTAFIREANCPVMVIGEGVTFKVPAKIVFACDHKPVKISVLAPLSDLAKHFGAHVYILNVVNDQEPVEPGGEEAAYGLNLDESLASVEHSFHYTTNSNVVHGISHYAENGQMDMIVMIPRQHGVFGAIFHEPETKRMAFRANVPLLALHE